MTKKHKKNRQRRPAATRSRSPIKQAALILALPAGALVLAALSMVGYAVWFISGDRLPDLQVIESQNFEHQLTTIAYTADGRELGRYGRKNRTWIPYDSLRPHVEHALVSTEDHRFRRHWGVDVWRTFSGATQTLLGKLGLPFDQQGGSTITQQLARNMYNRQVIGFEARVARKLKEMAAAVQLERRYSKDEIIEMYLNTVPFRHNAYGIEAAARTYFRKPATELDTLEAAALIGMLKASTRFDPARNPELSRGRRNTVLRQMMRHGTLDRAFYEEHKDRITPTSLQTADVTESFAPYVAEHVRQWTQQWGRENGIDIYEAGLRVYTTIDSRMQTHAENALSGMLDSLQAVANCEWSARGNQIAVLGLELDPYVPADCNQDPSRHFAYYWQTHQAELESFIRETSRYRAHRTRGESSREAVANLLTHEAFLDSLKRAKTRLESGLVSIDPRNGYVKAWVGGRDLSTEWYDHVNVAKRQTGSAFKPVLYATAINFGWSPTDTYQDSIFSYPLITGDIWAPTNSDGSASNEFYTLQDALARSLNTVSAQLIAEVGPDRVVDHARAFGIKSELDPVLSLALGTSELTLLELATAYTTLANLGTQRNPVVVRYITDQHGDTLYEHIPNAQEGLDDRTARVLIDMMRDVIRQDYGTGQRINWQFDQWEYDYAGKTGTTQEGADGWFMLIHPELVTGSWVGFNDRRLTFRSSFWGQGAHNALYVVGSYVRRVNMDPKVKLDDLNTFPSPPAPDDVPVESVEY